MQPDGMAAMVIFWCVFIVCVAGGIVSGLIFGGGWGDRDLGGKPAEDTETESRGAPTTLARLFEIAGETLLWGLWGGLLVIMLLTLALGWFRGFAHGSIPGDGLELMIVPPTFIASVLVRKIYGQRVAALCASPFRFVAPVLVCGVLVSCVLWLNWLWHHEDWGLEGNGFIFQVFGLSIVEGATFIGAVLYPRRMAVLAGAATLFGILVLSLL